MRKGLILTVLALVLFSCSREPFTVDSESLGRACSISIASDNNIKSYNETLYLNTVFSNDELKYSFQLKDPYKDLTWEGSIQSEKPVALSITPGASFPAGEWEIIYYGDNGTELKSNPRVKKVDSKFPYISKDRVLKSEYEVTIVEYDNEGNEMMIISGQSNGYKVSKETVSVKIDYVDRYMNEITIKQEL